jgi:O-methyltransferase
LRALLRTVRPYTACDPLRLAVLYGLVREIEANRVAGDLVECGVYKGGSAAILAGSLLADRARRLWLFDTFEGLPASAEVDGIEAVSLAGQYAGSVASVHEVLDAVGFQWDRVEVRAGLFSETLRRALPERIALLHIDADWFDSVLQALRALYPVVSDGGFVVLDDFGHWEGTRKAFYAFCREHEIAPLLERVGYTQAFWQKGAEHNRQMYERFRHGLMRPTWQ